MSDNLLNVRTTAERLRCSQNKVRDLIKAGELEAIKLSERGLRISEAAIGAYLIEQVFKPEPEAIDPATKKARRAKASMMGKASAAARAARRGAATATATLPKIKRVKCKPAAAKGGAL